MHITTRPRFLPWAIAFGITRGGDIWSTGLFMLQPGGEQGEMNPLTSIFGLSYWPLITINVMVMAILIHGHWHYCRHFGERTVSGHPTDRWDYQSLLFFGRPGQGWKLLFTAARNKTVLYTQIAHVLVKVFSCIGLLAVLHNCGQYYGWALNDHLRSMLGRPALVYYGLCVPVAIIAYVHVAGREFRWWQAHQVPDTQGTLATM